ncbi:hypothetical protein Asal01_02406 [Fodinibius salicampi]
MQTLKKINLQGNTRMLFLDVGAGCINKLRIYDHSRSLGYIMNHN